MSDTKMKDKINSIISDGKYGNDSVELHNITVITILLNDVLNFVVLGGGIIQ